MKPYKNQSCSETKRKRDFNKRLLEEISSMREVIKWHNPRTHLEAVRDYIEEKTISDHITRTLLRGVMAWFDDNKARFRLPETVEEQYKFVKERNYDSLIIGDLTDNTESVSVGKSLHVNPVTGDMDYVYYNASNEEQLDEQSKNVKDIISTSRNRLTKRVANASKPPMIRKKILQKERAIITRGKNERRRRHKGGD